MKPLDDETKVSEITILADGRIYVFGMSRQLLEIIHTVAGEDQRLRRLHQQLDSDNPEMRRPQCLLKLPDVNQEPAHNAALCESKLQDMENS